ncbi:MAG TPA: 2OG-Fe dioxygenase family protein [Casimicrobium sp.]|nr:2OG-Fe dioxygenase family protein [Casimicrobium sp.]
MKTVESVAAIVQEIREKGFCLVAPRDVAACFGVTADALTKLNSTWNDLPRDGYLKDGGKYRSRRHSSYVQSLAEASLRLVPHRAHWQPVDYNALHGGIERMFEPVASSVNDHPAWQALISGVGRVLAQARAQREWFIEAHQFRIDTAEGIGRPTPEGAHRDGVDFVAVVLVNRQNVKGGESRVFDAHGTSGVRFTLTAPWSVLLLSAAIVVSETTPIQPGETPGVPGVRDTLVITYRSGGFQDPV